MTQWFFCLPHPLLYSLAHYGRLTAYFLLFYPLTKIVHPSYYESHITKSPHPHPTVPVPTAGKAECGSDVHSRKNWAPLQGHWTIGLYLLCPQQEPQETHVQNSMSGVHLAHRV